MRILIADSLLEYAAQEKTPAGLEVEYFGDSIPGGDYVGIMPDITRRVARADIDSLPHLRIIANYGAGYDNIDVRAALDRGIVVSNTPDVLTGATAELTWALILAAARRLGEGERLVRAGAWRGWQPTHMRGMSLDGKQLGIIGAGRIGQEVGRRASAFGMRVVYYSRHPAWEWEIELGARRMELDALLGSSEVVSIHVSLNNESRGLIGARELAAMRPTSILVNTSRGAIVDEKALIDALKQRRIRAAALDVYEREPQIPEALLSLENAVLLPHLGSATEEARHAMWDTAWRNLVAGLRGEPVPNPVTV